MINETNDGAVEGENGPANQRIGFCQECGRAVTAANLRADGSAIFCDTCFASRQESAMGSARAKAYEGGWQPVHPGSPPSSGSGNVIPPGAPSPVLAAFLGFIPGVGAMYNGQFAKGVAHLLIFAVVQSLDEAFHGIFGILVAGTVFYQVFDAYGTAKARRLGLPLPDPFGLNDVGDRVGFGAGVIRPVASRTPPPQPGYTYPPAPPVETVPPPVYSTVAPGASESLGPTPPGPAMGSNWTVGTVPFQPTFTGPAAGSGSVEPLAPRSPFPIAAVWLIAIGALLLLGNLLPSWHLLVRWTAPFSLAVLALWLFLRRGGSFSAMRWQETDFEDDPALAYERRRRALLAVRAPTLLMTLAVLFALQAADVAGIFRTWPVLLLAGGLLMLGDRMIAPPTR